MSTLHQAIQAHLTSETSVESLIDGRVYFLVVPQASTGDRMPCVVINRAGVDRQVTYCGTNGLVKTSVTLDCYALRYTSARTLANEVRKALVDFRGLLGGLLSVSSASIVNEFDLTDIEPGLFRVSQSWDFWHNEEE